MTKEEIYGRKVCYFAFKIVRIRLLMRSVIVEGFKYRI